MKLKKLGLAAGPQRRNKFKASFRPGRKLEYVGQIGNKRRDNVFSIAILK
jgi:hypothetical protein